MFKSNDFEPNAKEYAFMLSCRFRLAINKKPVILNQDIVHRLNNEARDVFSRDFKIVSNNLKLNRKTEINTAAGLVLTGTVCFLL